ncbi:hypothetical protein TanjilG_01400 [Lupinus angustifolius]|uniref:leucine-rich repeat extensin-like protein 3 isoform X1 n=1 Tax=Lupinus angustifolius TaxID=3871 RepID=UPI00090E6276|nr:PREDICTED: leucine-rich repeat extensin-like protein 3 isoform X1 [Lupinus angustifolius]OIV90204.1 hypothetical protein TanjilG_01400 [Lupinus angustifolius]
MSWFLVILFLILTFGSVSEARHHKKLPSAVVVGTVYCDTCFQHDFSFGSHFISGASVAIECKDGKSKPRFKNEVKTNEHGEFKVHLPFSVSKSAKRIKGCTFKLISSSEPYCAVASAAKSSSLILKSRKQKEHIFSAGFFSFKPLKKPNQCNQKPSIQNSKYLDKKFFFPTNPFFPPIIPNPFQPPLIPNPFQPPPLIPNPFQPPPLLPNPFQPPSPPPLFPNPFQPPSPPPLFPNPFQPPPSTPSPLIPNPFQPPPSTPPPLIPNPFQPPPSNPSPSFPPLFPFPPIPGLTKPPPPPPPPPPVLPFPFPPLFPPLFPPPHSPGTPPASSFP